MQTDGQMKTGRDVVIAALLGAEEFGFATAPLIVSGCIMMRVCHLNTCPVGVATQDPALRKKFTGKPEYVVNYFRLIAEEVREFMAQLGFRTIDEMIGRATARYRKRDRSLEGARASTSRAILYQPEVPADTFPVRAQEHRIMASTRRSTTQLIANCARRSRSDASGVGASDPKRQSHRRHDARQRSDAAVRREGLPDDTIRIHFTGSAGQSFGAFLPKGITLTLEGDANDYFGKGLSGGKLIVFRRGKRRSWPKTTSSSAMSCFTARRAARLLSAASPANGSRSATAARTLSSKASAITVANT